MFGRNKFKVVIRLKKDVTAYELYYVLSYEKNWKYRSNTERRDCYENFPETVKRHFEVIK